MKHRNMQMRYPKADAHNKSINRFQNLSVCSIQVKWRNTSWKLVEMGKFCETMSDSSIQVENPFF